MIDLEAIIPCQSCGRELMLRPRGWRCQSILCGWSGPATALPTLGWYATGNHVVKLILDGGRCPVGVESTIVDCTTTPPQILRPGGIPAEQIEALLDGRLATAAGASRAPGMLAAHYAPRATVRLVGTSAEALALAYGQEGTAVIDRTDNLVEYARSLYSDLRQADARGVSTVIAVMPPPTGLGHAIRDRLTKAAAS